MKTSSSGTYATVFMRNQTLGCGRHQRILAQSGKRTHKSTPVTHVNAAQAIRAGELAYLENL